MTPPFIRRDRTLRDAHRAVVEAGYAPLSDYVDETDGRDLAIARAIASLEFAIRTLKEAKDGKP